MNLFLLSGLVLFCFMTTVFLLAMKLRDNSIVDIAYGLGFVLIGWSTYLLYGHGQPRQLLLLVMVSIWGLRLATHIGLRKRSETGEDSRYRQWRESWGKTFVWRSFLQIFMLQGTVIYIVALPLLLVIAKPGKDLGWLDLCGLLIWLVGFIFEAVGDWQLLRFKQNSSPLGWLAIISPLLIDFLLLKVSGIPMLEAKYEGNTEFAAYKNRTNAFFPWTPKT